VITSAGNVGVGTATPGTLMTLQGSGTTDIFNAASSSGTSILKVLSGNYVQLGMDASSTTASAVVGSVNPVLQLGSSALSSSSANGTFLGVNSLSNFSGNFIDMQKAG